MSPRLDREKRVLSLQIGNLLETQRARHVYTHHFLCSDSDGLGELHHGGLVVYKGALRFRRCSFINL